MRVVGVWIVTALGCSAVDAAVDARAGGLSEVPSACVECQLCDAWDMDGDGDLDGSDYAAAVGAPGVDPYADRIFAAFWGTTCAEQCTESCVWCHWLDGECDPACSCEEPTRSFFDEGWRNIGADRPAFEGAEGFGAESVGGRGGIVVEVTTLDNEGPGSLRAALQLTVPRTVVFRIAGTILWETPVKLTDANAYVTVAGHSAPGLGVQIGGFPLVLADAFHDGVFRHLRFRPGVREMRSGTMRTRAYSDPCGPQWDAVDCSDPVAFADANPETWDSIRDWTPEACAHMRSSMATNLCAYEFYNLDAAQIGEYDADEPVTDVIFDHCAFEWGIDEALNIASADRLTVQWSIIGEGSTWGHVKGPHNFGPMLAGDDVGRITFHHNLLPHNQWRNPLVDSGSVQFINNVVYNFELGTRIKPLADWVEIDIIGNIYKHGPDAMPKPDAAVNSKAPIMIYAADYNNPDAAGEIYMANNAALVTNATGDWDYAPWTDHGLAPTSDFEDLIFQPGGSEVFAGPSATPRLEPRWPVTVDRLNAGPVIHARLETIADEVGPHWGGRGRDSLDQRLVDETKNGGGSWGLAADPGDGLDVPFPELCPDGCATPLDTDRDGIPDTADLDPNYAHPGGCTSAACTTTQLESYLETRVD